VKSKRTVASAAWLLLGYTIVVILWGAFVRATGSGAGCGSHWPLCNGEVLPRAPAIETLIELAHRLSSGLLGLFVVAFLFAVFRTFPRGHRVRTGALWTLFFIITESLLGAGLVTFEWVAADDSVERVYAMAFHLVNTFLLLAAMTLTAWFAAGGTALRVRSRPRAAAWVFLAVLAVLLVGSSGAVTALGDTLLLREGVKPEDSPVAAWLLASRVYHPSVAIVSFFLVAFVALKDKTYGKPLWVLYLVQAGLGALNVYLRAPVWLQIVHLAVSDVIWILLVLLAATLLGTTPPASTAER
jgi:heme A synthase